MLLSAALLGMYAASQAQQVQTAGELQERLELALALGAVPGTAETERGLSNGSVAVGILGPTPEAPIGPRTDLQEERLQVRSRLDTAIDAIDQNRISPELRVRFEQLPGIRVDLDDGQATLEEIQTFFDELIELAATEADAHLTWTVANLGSVGAADLAPELATVRSLNELSERGAVWTSKAHASTFALTRANALDLATTSNQQVQLVREIEVANPEVKDLPEWENVAAGGERRREFLDALLWGSAEDALTASQHLTAIGPAERQASEDVYVVGSEVARTPIVELGSAATRARQVALLASSVAIILVAAALASAAHVVRSIVRPLDELQNRAGRISAGELNWTASGKGNDPAEVVAIERALDDLVGVLLTLEGQASALAKGDLAAEVLEQSAPGPLGAAFSGSVDQLRKATASLHYSENEARTVIDSAAEAIVVVGIDGEILRFNSAAEHAVGFDRIRNGLVQEFLPQWRELGSGSHETTISDANGEDVHLLVSSSHFTSDDGPVTVFIWRDITGRKQNEESLVHQARHDHLTGLLNRAGLLGLLDQRSDAGLPSALAYLDLDRFKPVNDLYGHEAGDHVLREVGKRLHATVRGSDAVARIGGDEFVVLSDCDGSDLERMAERLVIAVAVPIELPGGEMVQLGASVGWALGEDTSSSELLRRADVALYLAKASDDIQVAEYNSEVASRDADRRSTETELRQAITEGELRLHAQPIVDLDTGRTVSVEALVRWQHPERGMVPPGLFVPVAERSDLIVDLDRWVLTEAIQIAAAMPDDSPKVSINVSGRHLRSPELADFVNALLEETGCPAGRI